MMYQLSKILLLNILKELICAFHYWIQLLFNGVDIEHDFYLKIFYCEINYIFFSK